MKPTLSKFLVIVLLLTFLVISTAVPTSAQPPDPADYPNGDEILADPSLFEQAINERRLATVNDLDNGINASTTWWSSSGTTFVPSSSSITYNYAGFGCVDTGAIQDVWRGQVNLPNGSTIETMWFNYTNQISDPVDTTIILRRYKFNGAYDDILSVVGSIAGFGYHSSPTTSVQFNVVDNFTYTYVLVWTGRPDQNLCGVNIGYVAPPIYLNALPMITR